MSKPNEKLEAIFEAAVALETEAQRADYLNRACPDPELRREVESLLATHQNPDSVFADKTVRVETIPSEGIGTVIGRYKLLEALGEGGFGSVWLAEQKEPVRRKVALKVIKLGMDTKQVVARFEAERQALALMDHPNIAKILDAGTTEQGRPYFVMELVRGIPITKFCDENKLATHERLDLFIKVCHAVQHAHQKGIIHRDLKPSNVMVTLHDGVPVPKVIDFGIAKATQQELTDKTIHTLFQQFIGTPAYVSPEQAEMSGLDIDTRSDIYSLGVLLYELLTGFTPFNAQTLMQSGLDEMRRIIREEEPKRPSTRLSTLGMAEATALTKHRQEKLPVLAALVRGDLDWIVMKCLEKDRARRYDTANGLAMDLKRHLTNEPVFARPPSAAYRFQKLVRRNKLAFAAGVAVAVALLLGTVIASLQAIRATRAQQVARLAADRAVRAEADAREQAILAEAGERAVQRNLYASDMNLALQAWEASDLPRARTLLDGHRPRPAREDLRGFEWRLLARLSQENSLHIFPGKVQDAGGTDTAVAFSPDSKLLAISRIDGTVNFWDPATRQSLDSFQAHGGEIRDLAISPDGRFLATANGGLFHGSSPASVRIWDVASRELLVPGTNVHGRSVECVTFSPDSRRLLSTSGDKTAKLWAVPSGDLLATLAGHDDVVWCGAFAPDGQTIATASDDGTVKLWDTATGLEVTTLWRHHSPVISLAFSPDGLTLATGAGDSKVVLWDVVARVPKTTLAHRSSVVRVTFSHDGKLLACGMQSAVVLWDVATGKEVDVLNGLPGLASSLAFSRDGQWLASAGTGGARLWPGTPHPKVRVIQAHADGAGSVAFSRNGKWMATGSSHFIQPRRPSEIKLWDAATGRLLKTIPGHDGDVLSLVFSPDDQTLISGSRDGTVRLWDVASGDELHRFKGSTHEVWDVALSPDGQTLAASHGRGNTVPLWDLATRRALPALPSRANVDRVEFTPDGQRLVVAGTGWLQVWDTRTWQETLPPIKTVEPFFAALAISPGGRLAAASTVATVRVWDLTSGRELAALEGHQEVVAGMAFSPDGRTLISSSVDGVVKLWSVLTLQEVATLRGHTGGVSGLAFSPDGNTLATASADKTVRLWRALPFTETDVEGSPTRRSNK